MNDQSIPALVEQLSNDDGLVRERARHTLVLVGDPAVPLLLEMLKSPTKRTRWEAAKALAEIGSPESIPALVGLFSDRESDIRWLGAEGLVRIGPASIPEVLRLLIDEPDSTETRRAAHHLFRQLGKNNRVVKELLAPVLEVLGDTDPAGAIPPRAEDALKQFESYRRGDLAEW